MIALGALSITVIFGLLSTSTKREKKILYIYKNKKFASYSPEITVIGGGNIGATATVSSFNPTVSINGHA